MALRTLRLRPAWEALKDGAAPGGAAAASGPAAGAPPPCDEPLPPSQPLPPVIADVGTGSGAIALSLAQETGLRVLAIDSSPQALAVADRNRAALGLERLVELEQADLLGGAAAGSLRLIVSNPPYVASTDMESLAPDIRLHEPASALEAGSDGLVAFRRLLPQAARALKPGGSVLLEVGGGQAAAVTDLAGRAGFCLVAVYKDLSRKERIVTATLPGTAVSALGSLGAAQLLALNSALEAGAVIGVPTDTVYGLAARWDSQPGVRRLFAAKGRDHEQPVAVLFASVGAVRTALPDLDRPSAQVLEALLPGPFTFVVATSVPRPARVGTADSLGVRVPDHPALLELLASLGTALAATSANLSGEQEAATLAAVDPSVLAHCSIAFADPDSGRGSGAGPEDRPVAASTVVDLRPLSAGGAPIILREGAVAGTEVLGQIAALF